MVKLKGIEGRYTGGCKNGRADGEGTASGLYTYVGDFKKGVPDGNGRIEWNPDSVYIGEWEKGRRTGEGILVVRGDTLRGFWAQDGYLGEENIRYKLISKLDNVYGDPPIFVIQGSWEKNQLGNEYVKVLENVVYPFQAAVDLQFEFLINQPGYWDILVQF